MCKGETRESATELLTELEYNAGAITTYLDDAERAGSVNPIGPVCKITHSRKTGKFVLYFRDAETG